MSEKPIPTIQGLPPGAKVGQVPAEAPKPLTWTEEVMAAFGGDLPAVPKPSYLDRPSTVEPQYRERIQSYNESSLRLSTVPKEGHSPLVKRLHETGVMGRIEHPDMYGDPAEMWSDALMALISIDDTLGGPLRPGLADMMAGRKPDWGGGDLTVSEALVRSYGGPEAMMKRLDEAGEGQASKMLGPVIRSLFFGILTPLGVLFGPGRAPKAAQEAVKAVEATTAATKAKTGEKAGEIISELKASRPVKPQDIKTPSVPETTVQSFLESGETGATVSLLRGDLGAAKTDEWAVSIFPEREQRIERPLVESDIEGFIKSNQDVLNDPRVSVGVWKDDAGVTHLEPSFTTKSRQHAEALGKQFDQQGIFNLKTKEFVGTGGSGKPDISKLPQLGLRLGIGDQPGLVDQLSGYTPLTNQFDILAAPEVDAVRRLGQQAGTTPGKVTRHLQVIGAAAIHHGAKTPGGFRRAMEVSMPDEIKAGMTPAKWTALHERSQERYTELMTRFAQDSLPSAAAIQKLYKQGEFNKAWYNEFRNETDFLFGTESVRLPSGVVSDDADMFRRFFAASSSRTPVERGERKGAANVERAVAAFIEWKTGRPFSTEFTGHLPNLERVAAGLPFEYTSPKVQSFYLNLSADPMAVTVDGRTARLFGMTEDNVSSAKYQFVQELIRRAALHAGEDPREFQATLWSADRLLRGDMEAIPRTATDALYTDLQKILNDNPSLLDELSNGTDILKRANKRRPGFLDDEAGLAALPATMFLARTVLGAATGALVGDEEDRLRNALIGAGLGGFATPSNLKAIADVMRANKTLPSKTPFLATSEGRQAAATAKKEKAMPLSALALDYQMTLKEIREVRHHPDVIDEAELLANYGVIDRDYLRAMVGGETLNDAELVAAHIVLSRSFESLRRLADNSLKDINDVQASEEMLRGLVTHGMADLGRIRGSVESGRAVGAHKAIETETAYLRQVSDLISRMRAGQDSARLAQLIVAFPDPVAAATAARVAAKPGFTDMILEAWVLGLVSGAKTFTVNTLGNAGFLLWNIGERGFSRLFADNIAPGEMTAMLHGSMASFNESLKAAWTVLKSGDIPPSALEKYDVVRKNITSENVQDLYAFRKLGVHLFDDKNNPNTLGRAVDFMGEAARLPARVMLAPADVFFRGLATNAEMYAQALREANLEAAARGLKGQPYQTAVKAAYKRMLADPPDDILRKSKDFGAYSVFQDELGPAGQAVQSLTQASAAAKFILPFVKTPGNILKRSFLERTPLALLSREFYKKIAAGGPEADLALSRLAFGSMTMAFFSMLAGAGVLTGSMPSNKDAGRLMTQSGWQPGSINVSKLARIASGVEEEGPEPLAGDQYIRLDRLDPHGAQMIMAADFSQLAGMLPEPDREELAMTLAISAAKTAASRSWIRGVSEIAVGVSDPDRYGESVLRRFAGTFVPFSGMTQGITREIDPTIKDAQSVLDEYKKRVWPFSEMVIPVRDVFANPVVYPPGLGPDLASPFYSTVFKGHPVLDALKHDDVPLSGIGEKFPAGSGATIELQPAELDRYRVLAGKEVKDTAGHNYEKAMLSVIDNARRLKLSTGPDSWRAQEFRRVTQDYRERARKQLLKEFPSLAKAVGDSQAELQQARGVPSLRSEAITVR